MGLFGGHSLVGRHDGCEALIRRPLQQFGVTERAPLMEYGTLNRSTVQQFLERKAQAWRYPDVEKDLHSIR